MSLQDLRNGNNLYDGIDPNSPILATVQARITEQLTKQVEELNLSIKEIDEKKKRVEQEREKIGVELYTAQQQLVKLQESLDTRHDNLTLLGKLREETEQRRDEFLQSAKLRKQAMDEQVNKYFKFQQELEKLQQQLQAIDVANERTKRDIAIKKRKAHKIEKEIEDVEKSKKIQDFRIDQTEQQIRKLKQQYEEYEELLQAQKEEFKIASDTLSEATTDMDALDFEKKRLVQQWKSSLIGMQRRDEALKATEDGLKKQKEQLLEIENEIEGYKSSITELTEKHEQLTSILIRSEHEEHYLERQIEELRSTLEMKQQQYLQLRETQDKTDIEITKEDQFIRAIRKDIDLLETKVAKVSNNRRELEEKLFNLVSEHVTVKKDYQNTMKEIEKRRKQIIDREVESSQLENELSRISIDKLQSESHISQLEQVLKELEGEIKQKDKLIEKYELEVRRGNDEIEKKQSELDKLNRLHDKLKGAHKDENVGPLEATINNLTKAIEAKERENEQVKKDWVRYQNELVRLMNRSDELSEEIKHIKSKYTILSQRRGRFTNSTNHEREQIKELTSEMENMHKVLERLNNNISKNTEIQSLLADSNFDLENKILDRLRESERKSIQLQSSIEEAKDQMKYITNELVDVEKQIMYWEDKIKIQREIQEALDPEVGQEEITRMKKEIHLMEQKLEELKREQKKKIKEMEKAVEKRDIIITKGKVVNHKNVNNTKANIQRELAFLNSEVLKKKKKASEAFQNIKQLQEEAEYNAFKIQEIRESIDQTKLDIENLQIEIQVLNLSKTKIFYDKERVKKIIDKYQLLLKSSAYKPFSTEATELEQQRSIQDKISYIITRLSQEYPDSSKKLEIVLVDNDK
ncbi:hypothetical protein ABK040_006008 [Willaertia magna]